MRSAFGKGAVGIDGSKEQIRIFWDAKPCGLADVDESTSDEIALFEVLDRRRYSLEPFVDDYARFAEHRGRSVLEVGCGLGADLFRFARAGARVTGIDMSRRSLDLTARRF